MYSLIPLLLALLPSVLGAPGGVTLSLIALTWQSTAAAATWWKPTKANTFIYDADRTPIEAPTITTNTGLKLTKDVYIVDMEHSTPKQIKDYKAQGKKVVCYISAGSWEPFRNDMAKFTPACYCGKNDEIDGDRRCVTNDTKMGGGDEWDEWWLDIRTPSCLTSIKTIMSARIQAAKDKGCDGVDPDNMDVYANTVDSPKGEIIPYGVTETDQVNYLKWWADEAHSKGMAVGLKNAGNLLSSWDGVAGTYQKVLVEKFDFNVIEACKENLECHIYNSMLKAGKPQIRVEYNSNTTVCPPKESGVTFSVYSEGVLNSKQINLDC